MALEQKTTHAEEARGNLLQQFRDKPRMEGLAAALGAQCQDAEDAFFSVLVSAAIDEAEGDRLEQLGALVGEPRGERDDPAYRMAIYARVQLNKCGGTIEQLIALTRTRLGDVQVVFSDDYPAGFTLLVDEYLPADPPEWTPTTAYALGDKRSNFGNAYVVAQAGTSGLTGPSGTGTGIVDGTVTWLYYQPGVGLRAARFVLSGKPGGVRGTFWWWETTTPFGFLGDPDAYGFGVGEFASAVVLL